MTEHPEKKPEGSWEHFVNQAGECLMQAADALKMRLRFSIAFRTSVFYSLSFLRSFFFLSFVLAVAFCILRAPSYAQKLETYLQTGSAQGVKMSYLAEGASAGVNVYQGWGVFLKPIPFQFHIQYIQETQLGTQRFLFDLSEDLLFLGALLLALLGGVLLQSLILLIQGEKHSRRLLSPLREMIATAQTLSERNLSARICLHSEQNELKDLSDVLNAMLDRLEAAYNRQKQFVSDASHELRTPISVLHGYAGMLQRWGKDSPQIRDEAIEAIVLETEGMKALVENLLFLARHDRQTLSLSFSPFNTSEMLREAIRDTTLLSSAHQIAQGEIANCILTGDRASIKQALRIFTDNALKFTPPGGTITFSSREAGQFLEITVSDTGAGIAKEDLEKIFERFYRTESARANKTPGHGLGLSIARIIAVSHGGKIRVRSTPGSGSSFTLLLPIE